MLEFYGDMLSKKADILSQMDDADTKMKELLHAELSSVCQALGEEVESLDPLIDKWEQELLEGKIPDLSEGLEDA